MESIQLLNTAIIKSKEKKISHSYEERLMKLCNSPVIEHLNRSIAQLADSQGISRDQAALQVIEAIRELDSIWSDYVVMEGIDRLKGILRSTNVQ
jgi:predicted RNA polymerase sigma factor